MRSRPTSACSHCPTSTTVSWTTTSRPSSRSLENYLRVRMSRGPAGPAEWVPAERAERIPAEQAGTEVAAARAERIRPTAAADARSGHPDRPGPRRRGSRCCAGRALYHSGDDSQAHGNPGEAIGRIPAGSSTLTYGLFAVTDERPCANALAYCLRRHSRLAKERLRVRFRGRVGGRGRWGHSTGGLASCCRL